MSAKIKVGIIGASGYTGFELLRILLSHPVAQVEAVTSRQWAGKKVYELHRSLLGMTELSFTDQTDTLAELDYLFLTVPHTQSMDVAAKYLKLARSKRHSLKIIDIGTDFRLEADQFLKTYGVEHSAPQLIAEAVYGTCELFREQIQKANLIANPGCFANTITLALAPLVLGNLIEGDVQVSAVTGSSGSGAEAKPNTHHPQRVESVSAYNVLSHRHVPEIERALSFLSNQAPSIEMVPHSGPFARGIFATIFATLKDSETDVKGIYQAFAAQNHFIRLRGDTPKLLDVRGSNFCDLAVFQKGRRVVVLSALDNLVKGASGNAVQCMNVMAGFKEDCGLSAGALSV